MYRNALRLVVGMLALIVVSCATGPKPTQSPLDKPSAPSKDSPMATPADELPKGPSRIPAPSSGKASVGGVIYTYTFSKILPGATFYLTHAVGEKKQLPPLLVGPVQEAGDVTGITDDKGQFVLTNVPPGSYYLIVWSPPYTWEIGEKQDRTPRLIELQANQTESLGVVYLPWP